LNYFDISLSNKLVSHLSINFTHLVKGTNKQKKKKNPPMDTMSNNKPKFVILDNDPNMCTVDCVFTGLTHNQGISPLMQKCPIACSENLPAQGTTGNLVLTNDRGCQEPAKKTTVRRKREI
jgi:hypothetical protein